MRIRVKILFVPLFAFMLSSCEDSLDKALRNAGNNRSELEKVLDHYKDDPEKLAAAMFLIENMSGHYSYRSDSIHTYYNIAREVFKSGLSPKEQSDSLLRICDTRFPGLDHDTISDIRVVKADFLIRNIDQAFEQWQTRPWASHLTFDEFCEWLLPYKAVELQEMDCWRDTLSTYYTWGLNNMVRDDDTYETTVNAVNTVRNEINWRTRPFGIWDRKGYPLLSDATMHHITFGACLDYVTLAVLTYRSVGIPCVIDETPYWGRYRAGHSWYTILNNRGEELTSEWDISSFPGTAFFTDKRIPKVFRNTYAVNPERREYREKTVYKHPFKICQKDITDRYFRTSDLDIPLLPDIHLAEPYVYIATFTAIGSDWSIVDYGTIRDGKAHFSKMGRNVMYLAMGYDGERLRPVSLPFILHTDGSIDYIKCNPKKTRSVDIRRKYYQSNNVAKMRKRLLHGVIQAANRSDFADADTIYSIEDLNLPDKLPIHSDKQYRYWRYLSPNGSYGSIAELAFFTADSTEVNGKPIGSTDDKDAIHRAFDHDWLSNFETGAADGNWVGMDMGRPTAIRFVRIVPRGDDNDIHPGETYLLRYWNENHEWTSCGMQTATGNTLHYDNIPEGALMWVSDLTRGMDERAFLIDKEGNVVWW